MDKASVFKIFLIGLLSLTANALTQAQTKADSIAKFEVSIPDAHNIAVINPSRIGFMSLQKSKASNMRYIQVENGRIDSIGKKRTGSYMGNDVFEIQSLFLAPVAGADTVKIRVQDAQNNVYQSYSFPRNPSIVTFTGVDKEGKPQSVSIIHEWRKIDKHELSRIYVETHIYIRDFTKRVVRSGAPLDLNQTIRVNATLNGEKVDIKYFQLRLLEYNPNFPCCAGFGPLLEGESLSQFKMEMQRMWAKQTRRYLVIVDHIDSKEGERVFEYPFFEIEYEDLFPPTQAK